MLPLYTVSLMSKLCCWKKLWLDAGFGMENLIATLQKKSGPTFRADVLATTAMAGPRGEKMVDPVQSATHQVGTTIEQCVDILKHRDAPSGPLDAVERN